MTRYQIKVNTAGSWANLCSCPPEKLDAVKAACEELAFFLDHGIAFKVIDAASGRTAFMFNNRPKPGEPHGWHIPNHPTF